MADSAEIVQHTLHTDIILLQWQRLQAAVHSSLPSEIDGSNLNIASVIAIARYHRLVTLDASARRQLERSREVLETRLADGDVIYGVNTGFGGTADVRTKRTEQLQRVLLRELHYGILGPDAKISEESRERNPSPWCEYDLSSELGGDSTHLPACWIRAAILIRINSLIKGYSAVRPEVVDRMQDLLTYNIIPMVPLRGSISASGDLSPLSYIGGAIQAKPTIRILPQADGIDPVRADQAFAEHNLQPISLQAKEGLAIVNGTAVSCAVGALVLHDVHGLALVAQALTAMAVEALRGTSESFHPLFAQSRPHPGQLESSRNVLSFLEGSKLVKENKGTEASLRQDRYSVRTAAQWVGPVLEDLVLAHQQIEIECNSVTDNPLIGPDGAILHGGNFQAKSITSALEKARQGLHTIGRMLFSQCTEMINPATSRGLPPNLVIEDPSSSYIFKGTDISIAALQAELGFLSTPMNHVMTAEMGNQSINSLALVAGRYTHTAADVLSQLVAHHLLALCQALDIRAVQLSFWEMYRPEFEKIFACSVARLELDPCTRSNNLRDQCLAALHAAFETTTAEGAEVRFKTVAGAVRPLLYDSETFQSAKRPATIIRDLVSQLASSMHESWKLHVEAYKLQGDATPYLGKASARLYSLLRHELHVPFLHTTHLETPRADSDLHEKGRLDKQPLTVGTYTSRVYHAVKVGMVTKALVELLAVA